MFMSINVCWEPFKYTGIETVMEIFNIDNIKLLQRQLSRILSIHSLLLTTRGHSLTTWTPAPHGCTSPKTTFPITHCTDVTQLIPLITQLIALITLCINLGLPLCHCRVLYSVYPSDRDSTESTQLFLPCLALPCLALPCLALPSSILIPARVPGLCLP